MFHNPALSGLSSCHTVPMNYMYHRHICKVHLEIYILDVRAVLGLHFFLSGPRTRPSIFVILCEKQLETTRKI